MPELPDLTPPGPSPVVLLHGAGQMPTMWQDQVEALGAQTKALAPWLDGFRPGRPREVSLTRASSGLIQTLDLAGIRAARVVAHQFGSMVALQTAADEPARIERMVLSGAVVLPGRMALTMQKALIKMLPPARLAEVGATKDDLLGALDAMAQADFSQRLGEIDIPTLIVCCEGDQTGLPYARMLSQQLPQAELRLVPGNAPTPMTAAPREYNDAMTEFLAR